MLPRGFGGGEDCPGGVGRLGATSSLSSQPGDVGATIELSVCSTAARVNATCGSHRSCASHMTQEDEGM